MPAQSGTSLMKAGEIWINRGGGCGMKRYALAACGPGSSTSIVHIEAAAPFN
jgi:hypothetical protein